MKKLVILAVAVALASMVSTARAEDSSELSISGNVTTVTGWTQANKAGSGRTAFVNEGLLNDGLAALGANGTSTFGFFVDQVELDLAKSFGENIRIRSDIDFSPTGPGKGGAGGDLLVEQAYGTVNIPAGNGLELLVGRFNSGIGFDPIDRHELNTISFSMAHRSFLPHNLTGLRLGYDWTDHTRWEVFAVNDLGDRGIGAANTDIPSLGSNLSYNWGEEGNLNWVKLNVSAGPEQGTKKRWTFLGDIAADIAATEAFRIGGEGFYRQDDGVGGNAQFVGGQVNGTYSFSDVWDGTLRYGFTWDWDSTQAGATVVAATNDLQGFPGLGYAGVNHELSLATGYKVTDGVKFTLEGRVDAAKASAAGSKMGFGYGLGGMFAYSF